MLLIFRYLLRSIKFPSFICAGLLAFALSDTSYAQKKIGQKKDSSKVYKKIENFSKKNKVSKFLYEQIFRFSTPSDITSPGVTKKKIIKEHYKTYQGKIIRNINVSSFDPFGYNHKDTTKHPRSLFEKTGNFLHMKSLPQTIKHILIIKENEHFDSLRVRESERLVRSQSFVNEVIVRPSLVGKNSDSVDISIGVYDVWSIIVNIDISKSGFYIDIKDKSFLGLGHQFQSVYTVKNSPRSKLFRSTYLVPNIYNTYIGSLLLLSIDEKNNYDRSIDFNRPFYSPLAKWAGGISFFQHLHRSVLYNPDSSTFNQNYKYDVQDYWLARAWKIFKGQTEQARTSKLILTARIQNTHYIEKPPPDFDSLNIFSNETFHFLGIGLSRRKYYQDNYLFKYGNIEDVPVGRAYSIVSGYQVKNNKERCYLGAVAYWGHYYKWGYFSSSLEYGSFFRNASPEEGNFSIGLNYFTNIFKIGKWRLRQFIKPQCTIGLNRSPTDNLSINNELGIRGFNSTGLSGNTKKVVVTMQTQSYAPWNIIGFGFGPYLISSFGMLGTNATGFSHSRVYSQFGVGLLIKNEYLIYSSLQISLAFYPYIPGSGTNIFKVNPVKTTDFGFRDFDVGKPSTVPYR